jgi:S1-C subfamily serine protease
MDSPVEACPLCNEPASLVARVCPHCRSSIVVAVRLRGPLTDARERYRLARALSALGASAPPLAAAQAAFAAGSAFLVGVPRSTAREAAEILAAHAQEAVVDVTLPGAAAASAAPATRSPAPPHRGIVIAAAVVMAIVAAAGVIRLPRSSGPQGSAPAGLTSAEIAQRALASAVSLRCPDSVGSGFFVAPDLVMTNAHVLCDGSQALRVTFADGRQASGTPLRSDAGLDLALVQVAGGRGVPLPLGDAGTLKVGDHIVMIGSPVGIDFTVHQGSVSSLSHNDLGLAYIQVDATVNPGNSGGPLIDEGGRVVGVVSLKQRNAEGIGYALPINYAYNGRAPLVASPLKSPSIGFARMAGAAQTKDQAEAQQLAAQGQRPGVVAAAVRGSAILVQVVWPAPSSPSPLVLSFDLRSNTGDPLCTLEGEVEQWQKLEAQGGGSVLPPRMKAWLDRHGFASDLYVGVVALGWSQCPQDRFAPGMSLEMRGADPDAARIVF